MVSLLTRQQESELESAPTIEKAPMTSLLLDQRIGQMVLFYDAIVIIGVSPFNAAMGQKRGTPLLSELDVIPITSNTAIYPKLLRNCTFESSDNLVSGVAE